jgi:hypothetical protein
MEKNTFDEFLKKLDNVICKYLGLEMHDTEKPKSIKFYKNKLILCKNHIFQRHRYEEKLNFSECLSNYSSDLNKKIGIASGKAIATDLIISFEKVEIQKCP